MINRQGREKNTCLGHEAGGGAQRAQGEPVMGRAVMRRRHCRWGLRNCLKKEQDGGRQHVAIVSANALYRSEARNHNKVVVRRQLQALEGGTWVRIDIKREGARSSQTLTELQESAHERGEAHKRLKPCSCGSCVGVRPTLGLISYRRGGFPHEDLDHRGS